MIKTESIDWEIWKQHLVEMGEASLPDHPSLESLYLHPLNHLAAPTFLFLLLLFSFYFLRQGLVA